ncbi:uncharacterized protein LOC113213717 [Frankliniella occidentalis]|uniref:Uncharacterized protein LOC113213717 n=1 Tax=Frankliniella occidentalis TaxID=133901 RepID=A0A6J1TAD7_FRAOC|nr:uncharacterized protein LOC113213717 [Frankliniella occidentalis]
MGRNAYINFYIWYYNEHRGQAPVTTIAKRAGITWRKMTPQERDRFTDRNYFPKGNVPLYLEKRKRSPHSSVATKMQYKKGMKTSRKSNQRNHLKRKANGKIKETARKEEIQVNSNNQIQEEKKKVETRTEQKDDNDNENTDEEEEPQEITAKRRSIERWMDENHYT